MLSWQVVLVVNVLVNLSIIIKDPDFESADRGVGIMGDGIAI